MIPWFMGWHTLSAHIVWLHLMTSCRKLHRNENVLKNNGAGAHWRQSIGSRRMVNNYKNHRSIECKIDRHTEWRQATAITWMFKIKFIQQLLFVLLLTWQWSQLLLFQFAFSHVQLDTPSFPFRCSETGASEECTWRWKVPREYGHHFMAKMWKSRPSDFVFVFFVSNLNYSILVCCLRERLSEWGVYVWACHGFMSIANTQWRDGFGCIQRNVITE